MRRPAPSALGSGIRRAKLRYGAERAPQAVRKLRAANHRVDQLIARISLITSRCVGRPIRNLHRSPRPAPIDRFLEGPAKHENDEDENNADHHDLPSCNCASRTHACGNPDDGRRGESLYVMAFLASDNHARTQKTDASHDALNHAAGIAAGYRMDRQNGQGRAETQDAEGADAGRLSMQIAVEPEHDSNQGCSTEPKRNVESVHARKILAPRRAEGSPPQPRWPRARAIEDLCRGSPLGA